MHLNSYLNILKKHSPDIASAVKLTVGDVIPKYIEPFSFKEHMVGLLLGQVQSGKTGQVFGLITASADLGFPLFILLTTDNAHLQEQTFKRALNSLDTFTVCGENDEIRFSESKMRKPALIILKKNTNVLQRWRNNLASTQYCIGRPVFIIDDEGDAASLNTKVNQNEQSKINEHIESIKKLGSSSVFIQVTATPQSILLQTKMSGWKPEFTYYFPPGKEYIGGDFVYSDPPSYVIRLTKENELDDLRLDDAYVTEGVRNSVFSFLVAGAQIFLSNADKVCNFLIHPSVKIADHEKIAEKIGEFLNQLLYETPENQISPELEAAWKDLQKTKPDLIIFSKIEAFVKDALENEKIKIILMNSKGSLDTECTSGLNIIVGGNSLGRGVTFPALHTVYYCRKSKTPQADTFWQHCRMFGYDRDRSLMRIYLPPSLFKLFCELNSSNQILINQVKNNHIDDISLLYSKGIRPTRPAVIEKDALNIVVGGVNYFPNYPKIIHVEKIDHLLQDYDSSQEFFDIDIEQMIKLLSLLESSGKSDWNKSAYVDCLKALNNDERLSAGVLIVRRNRDIGQGTGTLLSPDDRKLGGRFSDRPVLTLYRILGSKSKGWDDLPLWIPNIKFPLNTCFYKAN